MHRFAAWRHACFDFALPPTPRGRNVARVAIAAISAAMRAGGGDRYPLQLRATMLSSATTRGGGHRRSKSSSETSSRARLRWHRSTGVSVFTLRDLTLLDALVGALTVDELVDAICAALRPSAHRDEETCLGGDDEGGAEGGAEGAERGDATAHHRAPAMVGGASDCGEQAFGTKLTRCFCNWFAAEYADGLLSSSMIPHGEC